MTVYKAKYIGSTPYEKNYYNQHWEYRGKQYIVTVPVGWGGSSDYYGDGYMSKKNQHKREQKAIDAQIEGEKNPQVVPKGTWTKEYEDQIWKMMGWD